jgi:hypothetical protein
MEVSIRIPDELAAEARERGVSVGVYVQELSARQTPKVTSEWQLWQADSAVKRISELRKAN